MLFRSKIQDDFFTIVGLSDDTTAWITSPVFMSRESAAAVLKRPEKSTGLFLVNVAEDRNIQDVQKRMVLQSADPRGRSRWMKSIGVLTAEEFAGKEEELTRDFFVSMMGVMTPLAFIVGTLMVGLTIYILVLEKLRDFAVLKTIGATNVQVYCIVLLQAFLCGILGYTLGILMALGIEHLTMRVLITRFTVLIDRPYILTVFLKIGRAHV